MRQHYLFPEGAEEDYPTPERRPITQTPLPDTEAIQAEIDAEFAAYEAEHGRWSRSSSTGTCSSSARQATVHPTNPSDN